MRDVFGIAVAIVIALLSQTVTPWSHIWWAGMIASAAIAMLAAGDLGWRALGTRSATLWARLGISRIAATPIAQPLTDPGYEFGLLDEPVLDPRMDTVSANQITTAIELLEKAENKDTVVVHYLVGLDDRSRSCAEKLCAVLREIMLARTVRNEPLKSWEKSDFCEKISEQMVQLRGRDILIYADTNFKHLPERDTVPAVPDPMVAECQLIIAFRRREEYQDNFSVKLTVDNGQPRLRHYGLKPRKGSPG